MSELRNIVKDLTPPIVLRAVRRFRRIEPTTPGVEVVFPASFSSVLIGSYSQWGEDLVLDALLGCAEKGFYVDVGANDPVELSNTKRFSLRGWTGINIEPDPATFARIVDDRPDDVNLNLGLGMSTGELSFYRFEPDFLSTFDHPTALSTLTTTPESRMTGVLQIPVTTLAAVLNEHLPSGVRVDFLSVDAEGGDLAVLQGNDWMTFRPRWVMVELTRSADEIEAFMRTLGYTYVWCNGLNGLFADSDCVRQSEAETLQER